MSSADAGGRESVAASMYGRLLRLNGYAPPVCMYFRRNGRIESGIALPRSVSAPPFDGRTLRVVVELHPFLERSLTLAAGHGDAPHDAPGHRSASRSAVRRCWRTSLRQ